MGPIEFQTETGVSRETLGRLIAYADLLIDWQKRINLVGAATLPDLWRRHMLDSAQLWPLIADPRQILLDLGSGAGFPGLVLAAMGAGNIHLVESDARKCAFLRAAARAMVVKVRVHHGRIEAIPPMRAATITARALADLSQILAWGVEFAGPETRWLLLKGREAEDELTRAASCWKMAIETRQSRSDATGRVLVLHEVEPYDRPRQD